MGRVHGLSLILDLGGLHGYRKPATNAVAEWMGKEWAYKIAYINSSNAHERARVNDS
jgi:hypothetical protein